MALARVSISPESEQALTFPAGIYPAVIDKCEVQPQKNDPSKHKLYWELTATDGNGREKKLFAHTSLERFSRSPAPGWFRNLGLTPPVPGTNEPGSPLADLACMVEVDEQTTKDNTTGQSIVDNRLVNIMAA
jgi:hypothetical protein